MKSSRVLNMQMSSWTVRSSTSQRNATSILKNSVHLNVSGNSFPLISMVCYDGKRKLCFSRSSGPESSNQLMIIQQLIILLKIGLGKASPRTFFFDLVLMMSPSTGCLAARHVTSSTSHVTCLPPYSQLQLREGLLLPKNIPVPLTS